MLVKLAEIVTSVSALTGEGVLSNTGLTGVAAGVNKVTLSNFMVAGKAAPFNTSSVKLVPLTAVSTVEKVSSDVANGSGKTVTKNGYQVVVV